VQIEFQRRQPEAGAAVAFPAAVFAEHLSAGARDHGARTHQPRGGDRRRQSRSGRRTDDPHVSPWHWRRAAWLFAAYVAFLSIRSMPATVRKWLKPREKA